MLYFVRLYWVAPILTSGRKVTAFEVQACQPSGPKTSSVSVYRSKSAAQNSVAASQFDFSTLFDDLTENTVMVEGLKPGMRYQFRVRPQIDGVWGDWDVMGIISDVLPVPAATPDAPVNIRVATVQNRISSSHGHRRNSLNGASGLVAVDAIPSIRHDCVTLTWTNRTPNGSPVLEFQVQQSKIIDEVDNGKKCFHLQYASNAYLKTYPNLLRSPTVSSATIDC